MGLTVLALEPSLPSHAAGASIRGILRSGSTDLSLITNGKKTNDRRFDLFGSRRF